MKKCLLLVLILLAGLLVMVGCEEEAAEPAGEPDENEDITFEIIDRSEDEVVAYVCGDHWHGELPGILEGDNRSLSAFILEDEEEVELDGEQHALGVDYADGADQETVSFDLHGDHVHVIGEREGSTEVVFHLLHNGEVDFETPPIEVKVSP